jgi:hypothetical protein
MKIPGYRDIHANGGVANCRACDFRDVEMS